MPRPASLPQSDRRLLLTSRAIAQSCLNLAVLLISATTVNAQPTTESPPARTPTPASTNTRSDAADRQLHAQYTTQIQPILVSYCYECHADDTLEADIDLAAFRTMADLQSAPDVWLKVRDMIQSEQMPPVDAVQPTAPERQLLQRWVQTFLTREAAAHAGDPGPVVLRRLNNAEYTNTLRDLTELPTLNVAAEFPVDGAAGEGFTNTGQALAMSPAMFTKYLDAAKQVAEHAVLLPDDLRFSPYTSRRDWTNETLDRIRNFYARYTSQAGGDQVNLQGIVFETNQGGRLPVAAYLRATLEAREALRSESTTIAAVAAERGLSAKFLQHLWAALNESADNDSFLLATVREAWRAAQGTDADVDRLVAEVAQWQQTLWKFNSVGHIGKVGGPPAWQEAIDPIATVQQIRLPLTATPSDGNAAGDDASTQVTHLYLIANSAGDGSDHDDVVWQRPRIAIPGRPDLLLRDVRDVTAELQRHREQIFAATARCLTAAAAASRSPQAADLTQFAAEYNVPPVALAGWFDYLGIGTTAGSARVGTPLTNQAKEAAGYEFIQGWTGADALSVVANASDQSVRIPGTMRPHSVAVHPSPTQAVVVAWRSPVTTNVQIAGAIHHAHPECGNGVAWTLELRRGTTRQRLATGVSQGGNIVKLPSLAPLSVNVGDVIALLISPRDGNHSCDLTSIDLRLSPISDAADAADASAAHDWDLAQDVSPNILQGNPHADRWQHPDVWHFGFEPTNNQSGHVIPAGSLLAQWLAAKNESLRTELADQIQQLLLSGASGLPADSPNKALHQQLTSLSGPLLSAALQASADIPQQRRAVTPASDPASSSQDEATQSATESPYGLPAIAFGTHPDATTNVPEDSLCVRAPSVIEIRLPTELVAGAEFLTTATLHAVTGVEGSVQVQATLTPPNSQAQRVQAGRATATTAPGPWTANQRVVSHDAPVIVSDDSKARRRIQQAFESFRNLFPVALCYPKIVPVDEVVTLTLFYREDDQLQRLMLSDSQTAELNRLWDELHFVSQDALRLVDAFEQLWQFATQDADPSAFEPLREPILQRAAAFRQRQQDVQPRQLQAVIQFTEHAFRRPLSPQSAQQLRLLYDQLIAQELPHDDALRLLIARVLVSPAFLYRIEAPASGPQAQPVDGYELANRLSYFLWASMPDAQLLQAAADGLAVDREHTSPSTSPISAVLQAQTRRMLQDDRSRRMGIEFFCQWLHIRDFDQSNEKSERHFPTFANVRSPMYEEAIHFFADVIQHDRSILSLLDADHTFLNTPLAEHYQIPGVEGDGWRRVDATRGFGRGGILTLGAILSAQSGASRTSPILRGNWLSEVVLGERLPRPPKNVPPLADTVPEGLSERELTARHSSDPACAKCHERIDPFGFALENFDAIGRFRQVDLAGKAIDTTTNLPDGTSLQGLDGLRNYLLHNRRDAFLRQFNRKLLGYALGRAIQLSDEPLLAEMASNLQQHDYRFSIAIDTIIASPQFQYVRGQ